MRVQIREDEVIGYGIEVFGQDTYEEGVPEDYEFGKYSYTPITPGVYNPNGFTLIVIEENENI